MKRYAFNEVAVFVEAWFLLHISKILIMILPFRKLAARLGRSQFETEIIDLGKQVWYDVEVGIIRASKFTFYRSKCYDQALTGKYMLKRRRVSSTLYFGLSKSEDGLQAHAWVRAGVRIVTGRNGMERFTPVAWFGDDY
jgi:hypothetical protein